MAFQDGWARPLADQMVDLFRVSSLDYVRVVSSYDPSIGDVTEVETRYPGAAALEVGGLSEEGGTGQPHRIECWINASGIDDIWPTTGDRLEYDGKRWKIISIDPLFMGDQKYACKVVARTS